MRNVLLWGCLVLFWVAVFLWLPLASSLSALLLSFGIGVVVQVVSTSLYSLWYLAGVARREIEQLTVGSFILWWAVGIAGYFVWKLVTGGYSE